MYLSRRNVYIFINFSLNSDLLRHSYPILKAKMFSFHKMFSFRERKKGRKKDLQLLKIQATKLGYSTKYHIKY